MFYDNNGESVQIFFAFSLFFLGVLRLGASCVSFSASWSVTASGSLKNTISPSTSMKDTCPSVRCLSVDLPKRCLFWSARCSSTSCRFLSIFSSCSCCARNSRMIVPFPYRKAFLPYIWIPLQSPPVSDVFIIPDFYGYGESCFPAVSS